MNESKALASFDVNVSIDTQSLILLTAGVFFAVLIGCWISKKIN